MSTEPFIKICGVREQAVLEAAVLAGATAVGLNFVSGTRRALELDQAGDLLGWARRRFEKMPLVVGVFADADPDWIVEARSTLRLDLVQLHGHENPQAVSELRPAMKAIRLGSEADLESLNIYPGDLVVVDARVSGQLGGTGRQIPLELAKAAARMRPVILAGGLSAENVADVIAAVNPAGVDAASGAEDANGDPSADAARRFIEAARRAFSALARRS